MENSLIQCPECGSSTPRDDRFCTACGLMLPRGARAKAAAAAASAESAQSSGAGASGTPGSSGSLRAAPAKGAAVPKRVRQREDSRFVGRSQTTLTAIRGLYGLFALLTGILALLAWGGYMDARDRSGEQFLGIAILTMIVGINIAGFVCFPGNPFLWTVVLAALQTLNLALQIARIEVWTGFAFAFVALQGFLVVALWASVPVTARFTKIQRERAAEAQREGKAASLSSRAAGREFVDQRRAMRTFAFASGGMALLALLAAWLPYRASAARRAEAVERSAQAEREWREQREKAAADRLRLAAEREAHADELETTAAEFRNDWGASNLDKIKSYFEAERQETFWPKVVSLIERRGWQAKLPPLGKGEVSDAGAGNLEVFYSVEEEVLKTRWSWIDGKWRIVRFAFSKL